MKTKKIKKKLVFKKLSIDNLDGDKIKEVKGGQVPVSQFPSCNACPDSRCTQTNP